MEGWVKGNLLYYSLQFIFVGKIIFLLFASTFTNKGGGTNLNITVKTNAALTEFISQAVRWAAPLL